MGPPTHVLNLLDNIHHLLFGFPHSCNEMGAGITRPEDLDGFGQAIHVNVPAMRSVDTAAAISVEQGRRSQIDCHADFIGSSGFKVL